MKNISKRIFLESLNCLTKGWFLRSQIYQEPPSEAELFLFEQGSDIAREQCKKIYIIYPGGQVQVEEPKAPCSKKKVPRHRSSADAKMHDTQIVSNILARLDSYVSQLIEQTELSEYEEVLLVYVLNARRLGNALLAIGEADYELRNEFGSSVRQVRYLRDKLYKFRPIVRYVIQRLGTRRTAIKTRATYGKRFMANSMPGVKEKLSRPVYQIPEGGQKASHPDLKPHPRSPS